MLGKLLDKAKDFFKDIIRSRIFVCGIVFVFLFSIILNRIFFLQIIKGDEYLNNFKLLIEKERTISATRGNIYDANGELLAYNELAYSITIEDNGTYKNANAKNEYLNSMIYKLIKGIEQNGDKLVDDFNIGYDEDGSYVYRSQGTSHLRFLADVFGRKYIDDLKYNKTLGCNEAEVSAEDLMKYFCSEDRYNLSEEEYSKDERLKIVSVRYALSQNSYKKYVTTTIAKEISNESVSFIMENINEFQGVNIAEDSVRKYVDSTYFAPIIGYTGKISEEEYNEYNANGNEYSYNDVIGKAGIEKVMEEQLRGTKGYETVYVDSLGKVIETAEFVDSVSGNDIYLTINKDLQIAAYNIIEQKLAGILLEKIINQINYENPEGTRASDLLIPISDVYFALINNNIIDISHFMAEDAQESEQYMYSAFESRLETVKDFIREMLNESSSQKYEELNGAGQKYINYIFKYLTNKKIIVTANIDTTDSTYIKWTSGDLKIYDYLMYAISKDWVDTSFFEESSKYSDTTEIFDKICAYINEEIITTKDFKKIIYETLIDEEIISGRQVCLALYEQNVLSTEDSDYTALKSGQTTAYGFMMDKIRNLEITPGQLALDPCSASCVITEANSSKVLACVSYPGYDNNKLANTVDAAYYAKLSSNLSYPLYNHATQEKTAPGSTFKMVTATAGLTEGVIGISESIECEGLYENITPSPKCWIYPSNHGPLSVSDAIKESCNYYFYDVSYRLSSDNGSYNEDKGIEVIEKYATLFGLDRKSGIEISESEPSIATEYPITAAIGQSNHNFSTIQLARYVATVANKGDLYDLTLLDKVTDKNGNVLIQYESKLEETLDEISPLTWNTLQNGMKKVVSDLDAFDGNTTESAGKTGTAEQVENRGNHALFVGFAPVSNPEIAIATRIAHGYTSSNTAEIASNVLKYYFKEDGYQNIINGKAMQSTGQVVRD